MGIGRWPPRHPGRTKSVDAVDAVDAVDEPAPRVLALEAPRIVHESPGCVMATWKNISIAVWATQATVPLVSEFASLSAELARVWPGKLSTVHLIVNDAPLPVGDARAQLSNLTTQYQHRLVCALTILSGSGFWSSAMRGFITSLHWLKPPQYKALICKSIEEGAAWLPLLHTGETGVYLDSRGLTSVLESLLRRVEPSSKH